MKSRDGGPGDRTKKHRALKGCKDQPHNHPNHHHTNAITPEHPESFHTRRATRLNRFPDRRSGALQCARTGEKRFPTDRNEDKEDPVDPEHPVRSCKNPHPDGPRHPDPARKEEEITIDNPPGGFKMNGIPHKIPLSLRNHNIFKIRDAMPEDRNPDPPDYTPPIDDIREHIENDRYEEARDLLWEWIEWSEDNSKSEDGDVPVWPYSKLAYIYRQEERNGSELEVLHRFHARSPATGPHTRELIERYRYLWKKKHGDDALDSGVPEAEPAAEEEEQLEFVSHFHDLLRSYRGPDYLLAGFAVLTLLLFPVFPPAGGVLFLCLIGYILLRLYLAYGSSTTKRRANESLRHVDRMDGYDFEYYVANIMQSIGYRTRVTEGSGDQGIDVIARSNGRKIAVQVKRYGNNVGNSAVQEAISGREYKNCDQAMVVTNSGFTSSAKELASQTGCKLISREDLRRWISRHNDNLEKQEEKQKERRSALKNQLQNATEILLFVLPATLFYYLPVFLYYYILDPGRPGLNEAETFFEEWWEGMTLIERLVFMGMILCAFVFLLLVMA